MENNPRTAINSVCAGRAVLKKGRCWNYVNFARSEWLKKKKKKSAVGSL